MRLFHRLRYFVTDAWDEWAHSPWVNLLAAGTLSAALFLAAFVVLMLANVHRQVDRQLRAVPVEVYLRDGLSDDARSRLENRLRAEPGVARVEFIDKRQALERYRVWAADMAELIGELDANPLPASFEVYLDPAVAGETADHLISGLRGAEGVDEVRFDRGVLQRLQELLVTARTGGAAVAVVVFVAVILVMASVMRLAVFARREEIEIMLLVGATPTFVRGPFIVAGVVQGLAASGAALLLVEAARRILVARAGAASALIDLVASGPLPAPHAGLVVAAGVAVGLTGSFFAVRLRALR